MRGFIGRFDIRIHEVRGAVLVCEGEFERRRVKNVPIWSLRFNEGIARAAHP